jgi:hypothetical protein
VSVCVCFFTVSVHVSGWVGVGGFQLRALGLALQPPALSHAPGSLRLRGEGGGLGGGARVPGAQCLPGVRLAEQTPFLPARDSGDSSSSSSSSSPRRPAGA